LADRIESLPPLREVIRRHRLSARKPLGQHFLLDLNLTRRIARSAALAADETAIEVGPGPGGLTRALLHEGAAQVVAIERDRRCIAALSELCEIAGTRLRVIEGDALSMSLSELCPPPRVVVANLPYNLSTALLAHWLVEIYEHPGAAARMVLMFQKEVADRLRAPAGGKTYGSAAQGGIERGPVGGTPGAPCGGKALDPRKSDRRRFRPASQDAATEP
jgi:16S rRNA (adenine1518-N6/adenine1519-N6)-dimethyltransferase